MLLYTGSSVSTRIIGKTYYFGTRRTNSLSKNTRVLNKKGFLFSKIKTMKPIKLASRICDCCLLKRGTMLNLKLNVKIAAGEQSKNFEIISYWCHPTCVVIPKMAYGYYQYPMKDNHLISMYIDIETVNIWPMKHHTRIFSV